MIELELPATRECLLKTGLSDPSAGTCHRLLAPLVLTSFFLVCLCSQHAECVGLGRRCGMLCTHLLSCCHRSLTSVWQHNFTTKSARDIGRRAVVTSLSASRLFCPHMSRFHVTASSRCWCWRAASSAFARSSGSVFALLIEQLISRAACCLLQTKWRGYSS
jgi:hypothetical protein